MLMRLLEKLFPKSHNKSKKEEIVNTSREVRLAVKRYQDASREIQQEIKNNGFSKYLIKENHNEIHNQIRNVSHSQVDGEGRK